MRHMHTNAESPRRAAGRAMRNARGFTMIEMLVVVAIVALLARIAMPYYSYYVQRAHLSEAVATLSGQRVKMEQYYQDNGNYGNNGGCGVVMPTVASGAVTYFTYVCAATSSSGGAIDDGYTITATGNAAQNMTGFVYTIDQLNNRTSNITASGWHNPAPNVCWAMRKDGSC